MCKHVRGSGNRAGRLGAIFGSGKVFLPPSRDTLPKYFKYFRLVIKIILYFYTGNVSVDRESIKTSFTIVNNVRGKEKRSRF